MISGDASSRDIRHINADGKYHMNSMRLVHLVLPVGDARTVRPSTGRHGIEFVEEEDARGRRRGTSKEVTNRLFTGTDVPGTGRRRRKKKRKETGGALYIRTY